MHVQSPILTESLCDMGTPVSCPSPFNMADYVMEAGRRSPDKTALTVLTPDGGVLEEWRYADLDRAISGTASGLRAMGLQPGERVALRIGNSADFPVLFFGVIRAGGIAVPTSAQLTEAEFAKITADATPRFAAVADSLALTADPPGVTQIREAEWAAMRAESATPCHQSQPDDPAYIVYTSGTAGAPKGVLHAHRAGWARRMMWEGWYGLTAEDRLMHAGAFNWTYTLGTGLTDPWAAGATSLILSETPHASAWPELAARHQPSLFAAVPGVYRQIIRSDRDLADDFKTLRHGLTAGERLPETTAQGWVERSGKPLFEALGMSEISTFISSGPTTPVRTGYAGRPQPGRRVAVLDGDAPAPVNTPGDLAISNRDPGLMLGYWNRPETTAESFRGEWFVTGDRVEMDATGYLKHLGRSDDVMTSLGYRVAAQEVEAAMSLHPGVAEVAACDIAVREDLNLIAAFIVPKGDWPGDEALGAHAEANLAGYKCPKLWVPLDALPRTANGKIQRRRLGEIWRTRQAEKSKA